MKWSSSVSRSNEDVKNFITDMHNEKKRDKMLAITASIKERPSSI